MPSAKVTAMAEAVESRVIHGETVHGVDVDAATRCAHYHGLADIVAIRFYCCGRWYPCYECHRADARHAATVWPAAEHGTPAVLCGGCGHRMTVAAYLACDARCPSCGAAFNPGCARHHHLYFEGTR
jgi:uncharacterized CHY-type Zn-finger protein